MVQYKQHIADLPFFRPPTPSGEQRGPIAKMNANENPLGPSPLAVAAIREAAGNVNRYPDPGSNALRAALAAKYDLTPEMIFCSNGSDETILLACLAFLREGDEVVSASPSFVSYAMRTREMGGTFISVPLNDYVPDMDAMADAITPRTRILFLCNPNNPTGTVIPADALAHLFARVPDDVLIVADEAYIEFADPATFPDTLPELRAGRQNLLILRTFAKIYGLAGLRLGYAFGAPDLVAYMQRTRTVFNVSALAQAGGLAALGDAEHVARGRAHAAASRAFFTEGLRALGLDPIPSATNFMAVHVGDDAGIVAALAERGVMISALTGWGLPGHIRISFGIEEENTRCLDALRAVI